MRRGGAGGKKRDANEEAIIAALRAIGVTVRCVSGEGVPDILCWSRGVCLAIEVKAPGGALTPAQEALYAQAQFPIVHSAAEALALFGVGESAQARQA